MKNCLKRGSEVDACLRTVVYVHPLDHWLLMLWPKLCLRFSMFSFENLTIFSLLCFSSMYYVSRVQFVDFKNLKEKTIFTLFLRTLFTF